MHGGDRDARLFYQQVRMQLNLLSHLSQEQRQQQANKEKNNSNILLRLFL